MKRGGAVERAGILRVTVEWSLLREKLGDNRGKMRGSRRGGLKQTTGRRWAPTFRPRTRHRGN